MIERYPEGSRGDIVTAPSVIDAARALRFRLWLGRHYYGKGI